MQLSIPPDLQSFVEQEFATGLYQSREEVVLQAVSLLRDERVQAVEGIKEGLADLAAGRVQPLDEVFKNIRHEFEIPSDE